MKTPDSCQSLMTAPTTFDAVDSVADAGKLPHEIGPDDVRTVAGVAQQFVELFLIVAQRERAVGIVLQAHELSGTSLPVLPIVRRLRV